MTHDSVEKGGVDAAEAVVEHPPSREHVAPDGPPTTRAELYAYYCFFAGDNGIGSFQYSNLLFQNLIFQAGFNPKYHPLGSVSCDVHANDPCHVFWASGTKSYSSVILIASGLIFLFQALIFLAVGSLADYGSWNRWVLRVSSVLSWAFEFGFLGVHSADKWHAALALYVISGVTFWTSYVFFVAIFPKLARCLPDIRDVADANQRGAMSDDEYVHKYSMAKSRIMNYSYGWNNVGFTVAAALSLAALAGIGVDQSTEQNNWGYSVAVAVVTGFWILLAIPWFVLEQVRPGPPLPAGEHYFTFGAKQLYFTFGKVLLLRQTFLYLVAYFFLSDGVNTLLALVSIAQTNTVHFSSMINTYLIIVQGVSYVVGVFGAYYVQLWLRVRARTMLQISNTGCLLLSLWGMVGIWTTKIGFHHEWEFWVFNAVTGFTSGAHYSYGRVVMSELVPRGREYLFFGLLGIVTKGSSWIGPLVSSAIEDASGNMWAAFGFVAALIALPWVIIFFINEEKSRQECAAYLEREAVELRGVDPETPLKTNLSTSHG